jgi:hypothetical protein
VCLSAVLRTKAKTGKKAPKKAKRFKFDWEVLGRHAHWLQLHHSKLGFELDIQVITAP